MILANTEYTLFPVFGPKEVYVCKKNNMDDEPKTALDTDSRLTLSLTESLCIVESQCAILFSFKMYSFVVVSLSQFRV